MTYEDEYAEEARLKWGKTPEYKESQKRLAQMSKADLARVNEEGEVLAREIASLMGEDPASFAVQTLIEKHYAHLRNFYEPNLKIYRGLAEMYVADPRFRAHYEKFAPGLAEFLSAAMRIWCDEREKNG